MTKEEREKYNKKMKQYEKLGALKFQKQVFLLEKIKFKVLKKLFPNFIHYFDKYCNWKQKIELKKVIDEQERTKIKNKYKTAKMAMRKELLEEKNRNYHMDPKKPTEIIHYLEWNKKIHKNGLITNAIIIPMITGAIMIGYTGVIPILVAELISAGINFQCMNIQNYNICRYKIMEEGLKRREENTFKKSYEEFGKAAELVHQTIEEKEELPSIDEIIEKIETREQLEQLKVLLLKTKTEREHEKSKGGKQI